jgi:hypothetical protein
MHAMRLMKIDDSLFFTNRQQKLYAIKQPANMHQKQLGIQCLSKFENYAATIPSFLKFCSAQSLTNLALTSRDMRSNTKFRLNRKLMNIPITLQIKSGLCQQLNLSCLGRLNREKDDQLTTQNSQQASNTIYNITFASPFKILFSDLSDLIYFKLHTPFDIIDFDQIFWSYLPIMFNLSTEFNKETNADKSVENTIMLYNAFGTTINCNYSCTFNPTAEDGEYVLDTINSIDLLGLEIIYSNRKIGYYKYYGFGFIGFILYNVLQNNDPMISSNTTFILLFFTMANILIGIDGTLSNCIRSIYRKSQNIEW